MLSSQESKYLFKNENEIYPADNITVNLLSAIDSDALKERKLLFDKLYSFSAK